MRLIVLPLVALALLGGVGAVALSSTLLGGDAEPVALGTEAPSTAEISALAADLGPVEVHRSASCSCCGGHVDHMVAAGFEIDDRTHADDAEVPAMKRELGIPDDLWSCHTTIVDGYAVEGHVPADVIATLLLERPDVDGIALPGMPAGAPGMAGEKSETWSFVTFADGARTGILTER